MKLRLQTDYALRALIYLAHVDRRCTAQEIATGFDVSKDHLVKVIQQLSRSGFVFTQPGRNGGISLARPATEITVHEVIKVMEGRQGVLECVADPNVCPMEPGCGLRKLLIGAEDAFYQALGNATIANFSDRRQKGGIVNLQLGSKS